MPDPRYVLNAAASNWGRFQHALERIGTTTIRAQQYSRTTELLAARIVQVVIAAPPETSFLIGPTRNELERCILLSVNIARDGHSTCLDHHSTGHYTLY